ncbi:MAG: radical SAM protein [Candidatus Saganbacteria bacterium]|nr:radical SAM protein [Candidatus Saganbacteria bacterium]
MITFSSQEKYSALKEKRVSLRDAIPLAKPFTILFEPASVCNFKCRCCFQNEPDFHSYLPRGYMKFEDFKMIADDLAAWPGAKIKVVRIIGFGEPLLNPATPAMVKYCKELGLAERLEITTNAALLTPRVARELIDAGLDYLRCSIYAVDQKKHEALTQGRTSVRTIRDNIAALRELRAAAGAARPFIYVKMLESGEPAENDLFLKEYSDIADEAALEKPHHWLAGADGPVRREVCPQPFKMMSVHFNGDVIMCDPDWRGNTCVGNALTEKISAIWGGKRVREFWRLQLEKRRRENESCRNCSFLVDEYAIDDLEGVSPDVLGRPLT